jgi:DNA-binding MarR family transcriptional regulator
MRYIPPVDEHALGAWRALLNAHAALTARIERALADEGLPPLGWYDVLWPLHRAPGKRLRMNALAEEVTLSRTGLVRLVDRIERAGLLRREPVPEDRRGAYVAIEPAGSELLRQMWPVYERALDLVFTQAAIDTRPLRASLQRLAEQANLGYNV